MLKTATIEQFDAGRPWIYAFRITGEVTSDDMEAMAQTMNAAFDAHADVDMMLVFISGEGSEAGASLDAEVMKSQFRSLSNVRHYVAVRAPDAAESMIRTMDTVMPVDARTFQSEAEAMDFLHAQPTPG